MTGRSRIIAFTLIAGLIFASNGGVAAQPLSLIAREHADGSAAFGIHIETQGGDFRVDIAGLGSTTGSQTSVGLWFFDNGRNPLGGIAYTLSTSTDRLIASVVDEGGELDADAGDDAVDARLPDGATVDVTRAEDANGCEALCLSLQVKNAPAGDYYFVLWIAGLESSLLEAYGDTDSRASVNVGPAHALGDPEFTTGTVNIQVQENAADLLLPGVKVIRDASVAIPVENALYGFWINNVAGKSAGHPAAGYFHYSYWETVTCPYLTGLDCRLSNTSWTDPDGERHYHPDRMYSYWGDGPGDYLFTIDEKVDAYTATNHYDPDTGTMLRLQEGVSFLTVADVRLPS